MMTGIKSVPDNLSVYYLLLSCTLFLFIAALGPGLYHADISQLTAAHYSLFAHLCHQDPARTFVFMGEPMAVCSRCIGIYIGAFSATILLPVLSLIPEIKKKWELYLFGFATVLNFIDLGGNYIGIWTNTLYSRLVLGILFGLASITLLNRTFFKSKNTEIS
ncbi:DUF2085 domain-containing protein [Balneola sp. MJW-20]|uniref:DUF2085 domain-containing protein n=1 Tax=Gracilimonas aurantiaca TaxID=3234185 RepID=UPI003467E008